MKKSKPLPQCIHIIAGRHRGRKIAVDDRPELRPSPNRVRETVFNWLQFELAGSYVLDAFAGTGAMGLEALSRGAQSALFCETHAHSVQQLRAILQEWKEPHARVLAGDVLVLEANVRYDVIFLDPPFSQNIHQKLVHKFAQDAWLKPHGKIYLEANFPLENIELPPQYFWHKRSKAGKVYFGLIAKKDE